MLPLPQLEYTMSTQTAIQMYEEALKRWETEGPSEIESASFCRDIASELSLAIKMANGVFPEAYGLLSLVTAVHDTRAAKKYVQIALNQDPYQPKAWLTKVITSLQLDDDARKVQGPSLLDPIASKSAVDTISSLLANGLLSTVQMSRSFSAMRDLEQLVFTFRKLTIESQDARRWLGLAETLFFIGEAIVEYKWKHSPNLFAEITNAPWDSIDHGAYAAEIAALRRKAEGRALYDGQPTPRLKPAQPTHSYAPGERPTGVSALAIIYGTYGVLAIAVAGLWLLMPIIGVFPDVDPGERVVAILIYGFAGVFGLGLGAANFAVARGLWHLRPWARTTTLVLSVISLFNFPLGTVFGGFALWYLNRFEVRGCFTRSSE
jgi:hypothetical protein